MTVKIIILTVLVCLSHSFLFCNPFKCVDKIKTGTCFNFNINETLVSSSYMNQYSQCFISDLYNNVDFFYFFQKEEYDIQTVQGFGGDKKWEYIKYKFCQDKVGKWKELMKCEQYCGPNLQGQYECDVQRWNFKNEGLASFSKQGYEQCNLDVECASLQCQCVPHGVDSEYVGRCSPLRTDSTFEDMFKFICMYGEAANIFRTQYEDVSCGFYIMLNLGGIVKQLQASNSTTCLQSFSDYNTLISLDQVLKRIHIDLKVFETLDPLQIQQYESEGQYFNKLTYSSLGLFVGSFLLYSYYRIRRRNVDTELFQKFVVLKN